MFFHIHFSTMSFTAITAWRVVTIFPFIALEGFCVSWTQKPRETKQEHF